MAKRYFPMFVDLTEKRALVVGAGKIAARRIATLKQFCENIIVVAPEINPAIDEAGVEIVRRRYEASDLDGMDLVLAATDDNALNADIARECRRRGVLVNASSDQALCDFFFPGVAVKGSVVAGVTAGGTDHRLAKRATEAVRAALEEIEESGV